MKKILALTLTFAMVCSMFTMGFTVFATETKPADAPADAIAIDSIAGLTSMEEGKYYYLTEDITLGSPEIRENKVDETTGLTAENDWTVTNAAEEQGIITVPAGATLDGNGHTIYQGFMVSNPGQYTETEAHTSSMSWTHAMFEIATGDTVTVKNLNFGSEAAPIQYSKGATVYGIFADATEDTDVTFDGITIWASRGGRGLSNGNMGLLMGVAAGYIQVMNSRVEGAWISSGAEIGGFIHTTGANVTLEMTDCVMNGRLLGKNIGGFLNSTNYCNEATESAILSFIRCSNTYTKNFLTGAGVCGILRRPGGAYCTVYMKDCVNYANLKDSTNLSAGIVSHVNTTLGSLILEDCANYGNITSTVAASTNSNLGFGGVLGHVGAQIFRVINCANYGTIKGLCNLGGVIGRIDNAANGATILGCKNYGLVQNITSNTTSNTYIQTAGGIVGQVNGNSVPSVLFENCVNYGAIDPGSSYAAAAGIASTGYGTSHTWTLNNCKNFGAIGGTGVRRAGGIVGYTIYVAKMSLNNCENYGAITSKEYSGGIACFLYQGTGYDYTFTGCKNYGTVQGHHIVGGIAGKVGHVITSLVFDKCLNAGTVKPLNLESGESIGGIVAWVSNASVGLTVKNCVNTGEIYGSTKNSQSFGAYGDSFGQIIGSYGRTGTLNNTAHPYAGGFLDWAAAGAIKPVISNCYVYGTSVLGQGAKSMTGWLIGYDNNGVPTVYANETDYVTSTVDASIPNNGAYGINVVPADGATIYYLKDTTSAKAAETAASVLGIEMIAGAEDEAAVLTATPEIRGAQQSKDKSSIRFVSAINSSSYEKIGFIYSLSFNGVEGVTKAKADSNFVYLSINAAGKDGSIETKTAESLCAKYLAAITFNNVPTEWTIGITVAPTATATDGTVYVGSAYNVTIVKGEIISIVEVEGAFSADDFKDSSVDITDNENNGIIIDGSK